MDMKRFVDPDITSLLVIDLQFDYCSPEGKLPKFRKYDTSPIQNTIPKLERFIGYARKQGIEVIWTRMTEDPKAVPENLRLKMRSRGKTAFGLCVRGTKGFDYYGIRPLKGDLEIVKNQYDAFTNPFLDRHLRSKGIKNIIFTGVYTARCVDSTLRAASARGYNCVVPEDLVCSVKQAQKEHQAALHVWNSIFAYVVRSSYIINTWSKKS